MQVTIGAQCWDGVRHKSLSELVRVVRLPHTELPPRFSPKLKALLSFGVPVTFIADMSHRAFATPAVVPAMAGPTRDKILHAFDPLIDMIQSLSYPIAGVMIAGGCLFIMCGQRDKGMQMLQNAAIGYILVQLSPMLLQLLVGIGGSV